MDSDVGPLGQPWFQLACASNSVMTSGNNITFRAYDANSSTIYQVAQSLPFVANSILGRIDSPIVLDIERICGPNEYELHAPTNTSDRVCRPLKQCTQTQYEQQPPTPTSNRVCAYLTNCTINQYERVPPTDTSDRLCGNIAPYQPPLVPVTQVNNLFLLLIGSYLYV